MPSYFYHLKLELYPRQPATTLSKDSHQPQKVYVPPEGSDIFTSKLPAHKTSKWTNDILNKRHTRQGSSDSSTDRSPSRPDSAGLTESPGDALLLPKRSGLLKESSSPALPPLKPSSEAATKDWRFGPVSIDSIDMEPRGKETVNKGSLGLHTRGVYVPSETKTTDMGWGVVHLYRDTQEAPSLQDGCDKKLASKSSGSDAPTDADKCTTLCILAVPSWMMPSDLLGFVGDQTREDVSHFRLIRTGRANKYMVLMRFRQAKKAREWQKIYNGRLFSAMEPENCHVVFISSVDFLTPDSGTSGSSNFPQNNIDPFTPSTNSSYLAPLPSSTKPYAPPTPSLVELPTCPVCLERMDETTGLLTILCQHVFHCACLEKWRGSGCPVCRYTQSPSSIFPYPRPSQTDSTMPPSCTVCASTANLWICLICGNTGCGRYDDAHAYAHYEQTSHCYAMDIASQHVWDYAGDGYVHRLIQNKDASSTSTSNSGARIIDLGGRMAVSHPNTAYRAESDDSVPREKMEAMANEYTYLLTSQLDSQRRYFEEQLERAVDKAADAGARAESAALRADGAVTELETAMAGSKEREEALAKLEKGVEKSEARAKRFERLARELGSAAKEEKSMNDGLVKRIKALEEAKEMQDEVVRKLREEKAELEDLNRDLSVFIESREKVQELQAAGEEVEMGSSGVVEGPKKKGKGRKR